MGPEVEIVSKQAEERFDGWAWPNWDFDPTQDQEDGVRVQTRREKISSVVWPAVFLFYLAQPISQVFSGHQPHWKIATVLALVVAYSASYLYVCYVGQRSSHTARGVMIVWLSLFPIALTVLLGPEQLIFFTYAVASALMLIPALPGAALGFGSAISLIIGTWVASGTPDFGTAMILVVLTLAIFSLGGLVRTVRQLRA